MGLVTPAAPRVSVIVLTYRRVDALKQTVASFRRHADLDDYELIVCDDGSTADERREIERLGADLVIWNSGAGYGDNPNSGIAAARGRYLFHLEDDLVVGRSRPFLEAGIAVLEALPELGLLHYSLETTLPRIRALRRVGDLDVEVLPFASAAATGFDLFRYTNRPHLKTRAFHESYGLYPEGRCAFDTEYVFARHVNDVRGPRLGWIARALAFFHIGHRCQSLSWEAPRAAAAAP
jgi:glycosyltransferase involved in cell wall biosynthesis